jgi:CheY-like chemotaxis protein
MTKESGYDNLSWGGLMSGMNGHTSSVLLIAEDDPDDQWLIQLSMETAGNAGVDMRFVEDGVELIEYLCENCDQKPRPRLVILDLNMPRKDGREALKEMKTNTDWQDIPVVVLTTSRSEDDMAYCRKFGVTDYFHKPNSIAELEGILGELCEEFFSTPSR